MNSPRVVGQVGAYRQVNIPMKLQRSFSVLPGFNLSLGYTLLYLSLIVIRVAPPS